MTENNFTPRPADLNAFAADIRRRNTEKGFWPESGRNLSECFMLVIEEIGEAITAHRKDRFCKINFAEWVIPGLSEIANYGPAMFVMWFEQAVKGTVDEELADIGIRLFDINGGCEEQNLLFLDGDEIEIEVASRNGFCEKMAAVTHRVAWLADAFVGEHILPGWQPEEYKFDQVSACIYAVEQIAHSMGIDLWAIVHLKLAYNQTRPFMHGKNY